MYRGIFLCVIISGTILAASSDNGLLITDTLENNNTPTKYPTNANVIRKWLVRKNFVEDTSTSTKFNNVYQSNGKEDEGTDVSFQKAGNAEQSVVLKKILGKWVSPMKDKSKNQNPILKANEQYYSQSPNVLPRLAALKILRERGSVDDSSSDQEQLPNKGNDDKLTPAHWVPPENEPQTITFNKVASNVEMKQKQRSKWPTGSPVDEEKKQLMSIQPIPEPWMQQYVIGNTNVFNSERNNHQLYTTTENKLLKETDPINKSTDRTFKAPKFKKRNRKPTTANPLTNDKAIKKKTESTPASPESIFKSWGLLLFDSKKNKLFDEEHDRLENDLHKDKRQPEAKTLVESAEVDNDRNKALKHKVETWYDNLKSRREFVNLGVSPELSNVVRLRRNLQSAMAALSQKRHLSEWQRSPAVDYRKQSKWRRQLLSQHSMPQAVDYRRLLSLWRKELRRQLQIKWNRRPLVEISPGAFKTDIYVNPPDDLAKHMQKLLALKKRQEDRNRDLNAGNPNA